MRRARMTKAAALLLAGSLALAACASDEEPTAGGDSGGGSGSGDLQVGLAYDVGGRGDQSFNDSAYAGVEAAIAELGGEVQEFSPNDDGSDRVEGLANLAEAGYDPVIGVGFAYAETIAEVAEEFPETTFAVVDSSVAELGLENATGLLFAEEQGSFLAGVAAALKSETDHVGFVGGVEMPLIQKFEAGFTAGAQAVNPDIQVDVEYISPAGDFSGFGDPARGQILARSMYDAGADIVFHAAGGSGSGVFQAAAETGNRAIGVDSDQYQTVDDPALQAVIMTSMLKRVDNAVEAFITDYSEGTVEGGVDLLYDLESDGVGLATSGGQIDDIQTQIEDYRQRIISGEITVPTTP
ncbi:BMP family ABC transporter substrate-binding protein [Blastococcus sp. MG754426]|uniref:BMP family lipoprotein n=1 Tax=unclassified Blastococcus TaxID=2619396 RepID=UPI001EF06330|nr:MULTISPECIES: BMP family ABC transporter substrate-binding protein [unclassified Blastococcus]MCF6509094.1 BMP family ABC transporter substrate-binding protein [Blastococcus sp. MG754426]MCF6513712.1 BMP family ABC transporter substrate-binding protein [Blastococcus sp. MG754427]MCF6736551.1 BMP family ABC transporter substrate-binding protein [Blastococcus sp. KM273129]